MRTSQTFLLGLALLIPSICCGQTTDVPHAQTKCPWLNEATAAGVLGAEVTAVVKTGERGDGVCEFSRQDGAVVRELRISVDTLTDLHTQFSSYLAQCPPHSTPLQTIGNEAVTCSTTGKPHRFAQKVVGRVRTQAFVVTLSSTLRDDPVMSEEVRREKAKLVAEQIAGILF